MTAARTSSFRRFAWSVLGWDLAVIAWGAYVRATGSGAGCGRHWPTCQGEVIPRSPAVETLIELTHRVTSGLAFLLVVALVVWARRVFSPGHPARRAAALSLAFMVTEALLGAGLVLFGWVARDASAARGLAMSLHLANTFALLAALALTAAWSDGPAGLSTRGRGALPLALALGAGAMLLAGVTGAVAALGDTLFPAATLAEGLRQDLDPRTALLLRLRVVHPPAAVLAGLILVYGASLAARGSSSRARRAALVLSALVVAQIVAGAVNLGLGAPVWLQLVHLLLADLVWIALVVLAAASLGPAGAAAPSSGPLPSVAGAAERT